MATQLEPEHPVRRNHASWSEFSSSDSVGDRLLSVYRTVRAPGAVAAGVGNLILTFVFDWAFGWVAVAAAAVVLIDSIVERRRPRKSPEVTIIIDATALGLTMVAIGLPAVSFSLGLWIVLLTAVLASGWWRPFLYAYVVAWAVLANVVTWSGVREWTRLEVLILDWTFLVLVGVLVVRLLEVALRRIREMEEERTYMMGVVGHELGNSLTSVTATAATLERHADRLSHEEVDRMVAAIRAQAQESADIADDLLTLARLRQDSLVVRSRAVDVWEETTAVVQRAMEATGETVEMSDRIDVWTSADPLRFRQVIRNLLINAIEYGGGEISVSVAVSNGEVVVSVRDRGEGLPPGELDQIFDPYWRVSGLSKDDGAGLGLWVAHRLAQEMGGRVLYKRDGGFTVFDVVFPSRDPDSFGAGA